ncbi:hypothetical protein KY284_005224 [Solanum tuberosum]|nr:hypothetical protein KY284_005224 [Solanum tuberosum]
MKFLSYAGRLQLVQSILTSIQAFWAQIFLLPKKVLQQVETICKRFLLNDDAQTKGKALVAWDKLCWPKVAGGMNITDVYVWNKVAILKYMWDLSKKKDKLWIVWVHTYYIKDRRPWEVQAKQASWVVRKILQAGHWISEAGLHVTEVMEEETFTIKDIYKILRGELSKVPWRRMICNNQGSPKWTFILYLAIQRILYTKDRLDKWGINTDSICSMCKAEPEIHQHLFFACSVANVIWQRLLRWLSITKSSAGWNEEIEWATMHANRKIVQDEVYRMTLVAALYYIWQDNNYRIFQQRERSIEEIIKQIIQEIHCRSCMNPRLASAMHKLKFYP